IITMARDKGIEFFSFPSHTTHKLQPLDVGVFGIVETNWGRHVDIVAAQGNRITKTNFISHYLEVRDKSLSKAAIVSAWKKCGLDPINPDIFDDRDFAPSWNTSIQLHVPENYP
ncbi:hypothetical protein CYLTODRAFT_316594, partial [Cylindrobasidium torrendii FP15055 ss-10]